MLMLLLLLLIDPLVTVAAAIAAIDPAEHENYDELII